jgi:hypothetical protein
MTSFLKLFIILVQIFNETKAKQIRKRDEFLNIDNSLCMDFDFYAQEFDLKNVCAISFGLTHCREHIYRGPAGTSTSTKFWKSNYKGQNTNHFSHYGSHIRSLIVGPGCKFTTLKVSNFFAHTGCPITHGLLTRWAVDTFSTTFYSDGISINANMAWILIDFRRVFF